jgi:hypothetical protein
MVTALQNDAKYAALNNWECARARAGWQAQTHVAVCKKSRAESEKCVRWISRQREAQLIATWA